MHGAVTESLHVFISAGMNACRLPTLNVFEMGFGTGLNALLTWLECKKQGRRVYYRTVELNPLDGDIVRKLNYEKILRLKQGNRSVFRFMHKAPWGKEILVDKHFVFYKFAGNIYDYHFIDKADVVYFDAFSPDKQPDVWKYEIFEKLFRAMSDGAILTTYCAKGRVKRILNAVGFKTEALPGPPGKREMIRAVKMK
jgi:tRNA U34 5-methylaminomethyl-2-thiouridine-forming methyltransferase MnmC